MTCYTLAKYVAFIGFGAGALLIFGPMVSPTVGHWLLSIGAISGVTAERWPGVRSRLSEPSFPEALPSVSG